jgi:hypothetical protein
MRGVQFALNVLTRVGEWFLDELGMISPPQSPSRASPKQSGGDIGGTIGGKKRKAIHNIFIGLSIRSLAQISSRRMRLRLEAELPHSNNGKYSCQNRTNSHLISECWILLRRGVSNRREKRSRLSELFPDWPGP